MQWFEGASTQDKLAALFVYLNNGDPINATMIGKLLKHVYRETKEVRENSFNSPKTIFLFFLQDEIRVLSNEFMQQLGSNEHGNYPRMKCDRFSEF